MSHEVTKAFNWEEAQKEARELVEEGRDYNEVSSILNLPYYIIVEMVR
jgi:hypothetical protein